MGEWIAFFADLGRNWRERAERNREASRRACLLDRMIAAAETDLRQRAASANGRAEFAAGRLRSLRDLAERLVAAREDLWVSGVSWDTVSTLREFRTLVAHHEGITEKLEPMIAAVIADLRQAA